jgi:hypothetical protein
VPFLRPTCLEFDHAEFVPQVADAIHDAVKLAVIEHVFNLGVAGTQGIRVRLVRLTVGAYRLLWSGGLSLVVGLRP